MSEKMLWLMFNLSSTYIIWKLHFSTVVQSCEDASSGLFAGLDQEGIFRISGNLRTIEQLKLAFDNGSEVNFDEDEVDIMAVAGLLKLFLRELPDSLIPEVMVKQFITVQASEYTSSVCWCNALKLHKHA